MHESITHHSLLSLSIPTLCHYWHFRHSPLHRWMNKFSPASTFQTPADAIPTNTSTANVNNSNSSTAENESTDTDFDFGDLVTMTIIDVFETDNDGKLLSYCPTFDNRAVHKTQESIERLRKGASQLREIARSPAGVKVNKVSIWCSVSWVLFNNCFCLVGLCFITSMIHPLISISQFFLHTGGGKFW